MIKNDALRAARKAALRRAKGITGDATAAHNKAVADISKPLIDATHKIMLAKASIEDALLYTGSATMGSTISATDYQKAIAALQDLNDAVNTALECHSNLKGVMRSISPQGAIPAATPSPKTDDLAASRFSREELKRARALQRAKMVIRD